MVDKFAKHWCGENIRLPHQCYYWCGIRHTCHTTSGAYGY
jgi:hypothetical protein